MITTRITWCMTYMISTSTSQITLEYRYAKYDGGFFGDYYKYLTVEYYKNG